MMRRGKNYKKAKEKIGVDKSHLLDEAIKLVKECSYAKFDETVEAWVHLGVNPKHSEQMVRGTTVLPHGTGKQVKVLVFAKGEKEKQAREAGADFVGSEEYIEKIKSGWIDFDATVATPDMMGTVGKLGKILGTKGLMPNPKLGTVTFDVAKAVKELKGGRVEYRVDKSGNIGVSIGKRSFTQEQLLENARHFFEVILHARPASLKGQYLKSATLSSTMGPGISLDPQALINLLKK